MDPLPTGTVTFLFTDLEGSTRLVQRLGEAYPAVLERHVRLISDAITAASGTSFGSEGDAVFAVFRDAAAAATAAAVAQRALAAEPWPEDVGVRVRMGLHTGAGTLGGTNYVGLDVHRAARIAAAGHGGQIVLSAPTRAALGESLPRGLALRDLGLHRLKDLAEAEHLYQLDVAGLETEFPELRSLEARPNNLPVQLTSFLGRETELASLGRLLDEARLVTLTGPGGTGKTRLATQVAAERLSRYGDGAFFVDLAPIADPSLVPSAIAASAGIREAADRPLATTLAEELRDREMLLVLDNFEHVTEAAPVVADLLAAARRLRALVTSRTVLHLSGEREFPVPPLAVPDPARLPPLTELSTFEGVTLFVERAQAARPDFAVTDESWPTVAAIVAKLDGLPLAIELAAAKTRALDPPQIYSRLGDRLAFLAGGPRDAPSRQRALRETIAWSHDLLEPGEQTLFRRLSVFAGGWTLDAAAAVCRPSELGLDELTGIETLLDQSLIRRAEGRAGEQRFAMLETIREFAAERLADGHEAEDVARRHAEHFTAFAEQLEPELTQSAGAVDQMEHDHDNLRAALAWAIDRDEADISLRLAYATWRFWQLRSHLREGRMWFDRLLALPAAAARTGARAKGLTGAAGIAYWQNDYPSATAWYEEAESIYREIGDRHGVADAIYNLGSMAAIRGDMEAVGAAFAEGKILARDLGDAGLLLRFLEAEGYTAFMSDDLETARTVLDEALAMAEASDDAFAVATSHHTVGQVARLQGRLDDAAVHYRSAIAVASRIGDTVALTEPLQGLAAVLIAGDDPETGLRLLGANAGIRERAGGGPPPEYLRLGDPFTVARERLGDDRYEATWEAGRALSVEEAIAEALGPVAPRSGNGAGPA
jgi:predicted ATPase/class 3 adenylate cyclase